MGTFSPYLNEIQVWLIDSDYRVTDDGGEFLGCSPQFQVLSTLKVRSDLFLLQAEGVDTLAEFLPVHVWPGFTGLPGAAGWGRDGHGWSSCLPVFLDLQPVINYSPAPAWREHGNIHRQQQSPLTPRLATPFHPRSGNDMIMSEGNVIQLNIREIWPQIVLVMTASAFYVLHHSAP